jgi:hypothetical protein
MRCSAIVLAAFLLSLPRALEAQVGWFPDRRAFDGPAADPLEPRVAGGLVFTDLLEVRPGVPYERPAFAIGEPAGDLESDLQATVALGGTVPLWGTRFGSDGAIVVAPQLAVFARFRLEPPSRDEAGSDWVVALPVEVRFDDRFSGRVRLMHRSAHLGDELMQAEGGPLRLEFSIEAVDGLVAFRPLPGARVYGGGTLILRSQTFRWVDRGDGTVAAIVDFDDSFEVQGGAEADGGGVWRWRLAADVRAAQRSEWDTRVAAIAGVGREVAGRELRLQARLQSGVSSLGEFFRTDETLWGIELEFVP